MGQDQVDDSVYVTIVVYGVTVSTTTYQGKPSEIYNLSQLNVKLNMHYIASLEIILNIS